jgi:hypothetical protein
MYRPPRFVSEPEENTVSFRIFSNPNEYSFNNGILLLVNIVFLGFCIFAITEINHSDHWSKYESLCGSEGQRYYQWFLARVILSALEILVVFFFAFLVGTITQKGYDSFVATLAFQFFTHLIYVVVGSILTANIMTFNNCEKCRRVMTEASFSKDPLLLVLGWVFVGIDSMAVLSFFMLAVATGIFSRLIWPSSFYSSLSSSSSKYQSEDY